MNASVPQAAAPWAATRAEGTAAIAEQVREEKSVNSRDNQDQQLQLAPVLKKVLILTAAG